LHAHRLIHQLPALEHQQCRDAANAEVPRHVRVLVHVHLGDHRLVLQLARERFDGGRQHAAGTTPLGPEIHQHRLGRAANDRVEVCVRQFLYVL
jgi:hypothetical protein